MTNGSLMEAKVLHSAPLGAFCNNFDLHLVIICIENQFWLVFESGRFTQVLLFSLEVLPLGWGWFGTGVRDSFKPTPIIYLVFEIR